MFSRAFIHFWLAFLLLFAQSGAIAHSVTHFADDVPSHSRHDKQLPHSPVCDKCVVYAEIGGSIPATAHFFTAQQLDAVALYASLPVFFLSPANRGYSSRAPPRLV